jgi:hypothetical protein
VEGKHMASVADLVEPEIVKQMADPTSFARRS